MASRQDDDSPCDAKIYDGEGHAHFVTFSCYRRRRHLHADVAKRIVLETLRGQLERSAGFCIGFVIMPNHVHAIVWHDQSEAPTEFIKQWKRLASFWISRVESVAMDDGEATSRDPIWQPRYYGFNLYSRAKIEEKLTYMHQNPVRAGFVARASDWPWNSARYYELGEDVGVPIHWVE